MTDPRNPAAPDLSSFSWGYPSRPDLDLSLVDMPSKVTVTTTSGEACEFYPVPDTTDPAVDLTEYLTEEEVARVIERHRAVPDSVYYGEPVEACLDAIEYRPDRWASVVAISLGASASVLAGAAMFLLGRLV